MRFLIPRPHAFLRIDHIKAERLVRIADKPMSNVPSTTIISDSMIVALFLVCSYIGRPRTAALRMPAKDMENEHDNGRRV